MTIYIPQHFPFQGPTKGTQIGIFGMKINHLATLITPTKISTISLKECASGTHERNFSPNYICTESKTVVKPADAFAEQGRY
jgi:hypothetical protein